MSMNTRQRTGCGELRQDELAPIAAGLKQQQHVPRVGMPGLDASGHGKQADQAAVVGMPVAGLPLGGEPVDVGQLARRFGAPLRKSVRRTVGLLQPEADQRPA